MSNYIIDTTEKYIENYNKSIAEPEKFWNDLAKNNLVGMSDGLRF